MVKTSMASSKHFIASVDLISAGLPSSSVNDHETSLRETDIQLVRLIEEKDWDLLG